MTFLNNYYQNFVCSTQLMYYVSVSFYDHRMLAIEIYLLHLDKINVDHQYLQIKPFNKYFSHLSIGKDFCNFETEQHLGLRYFYEVISSTTSLCKIVFQNRFNHSNRRDSINLVFSYPYSNTNNPLRNRVSIAKPSNSPIIQSIHRLANYRIEYINT